MPKKDFNKTEVKNKIFIKFFYYENKLIYPVHTSDQKVKNSMDLFIIIEFKNYSKQIPAPFKTYADFECILKSVKSNEKQVVLVQKNIKITFHVVLLLNMLVLIINLAINLAFSCYLQVLKRNLWLQQFGYCKKVMKKIFKKNLIMTE